MRLQVLPGGPDRKARSLNLMLKLIERGKRDPKIRILTSSIIKNCKEGNFKDEVTAIAFFIKDNIRYQRDPEALETIADAWDTLKLGFGDCDDLVVLASSMLQSVGVRTRVRVVGRETLSHVLLDYEDKGFWYSLDLARPREKIFMNKTFPLDNVIEKKKEASL